MEAISSKSLIFLGRGYPIWQPIYLFLNYYTEVKILAQNAMDSAFADIAVDEIVVSDLVSTFLPHHASINIPSQHLMSPLFLYSHYHVSEVTPIIKFMSRFYMLQYTKQRGL